MNTHTILNFIYFALIPYWMFLGWIIGKSERDILRGKIRVHQSTEEFYEFLRDRGGRNLQ